MKPATVADILTFWFDHVGSERWFGGDATALDTEIRQRFSPLWEAERRSPIDRFLTDPGSALAAMLLFDQFPRNMFRDTARAFATDDLALSIAREAVRLGFDRQMPEAQRQFAYMPFMHSELRDDQDRANELFATLADKEPLKFARQHQAVIERFGRFPTRNAALGRESTAEEKAFLKDAPQW